MMKWRWTPGFLGVACLLVSANGSLRAQPVAAMNAPHYNGAAEVADGKLYVWGGYGVEGRATSGLEVYDPSANSWAKKASLPGAAGGQANFILGGQLYSVGGESSIPGEFTSAVYRYELTTDTWAQLADFPNPTSELMGAVVGKQAYVFGGRHGYGPTYPDVYAYDEATDAWLPRASMPIPVMEAGVASLGGRIYVFGGTQFHSEEEREAVPKVQVFDPAADTWTLQDMPWTLPQAGAAVEGDFIYVFAKDILTEGGTTARNARVYRYTCATGVWSQADFTVPETTHVVTPRLQVIEGYVYFTDSAANGVLTANVTRVLLASLFGPTTDVEVEIALHAGVTVKGTPGKTYAIQAATIAQPTDWVTVFTLTLAAAEQTWFDPQPASQPRRFYRAEAVQP